MDFKILVTRFRQFGGLRLVIEYAKLGVLWVGIKAFFRCFVRGQSYKAIYPKVLKIVNPVLINRYSFLMRERMSEVSLERLDHNRSKIVWFCWLQGLESAPQLVLQCYASLKHHLPDREIKIIDNNNWQEFVELPEYVLKKWKRGRIPPANFSDLLRLQLLIRYGGTWVDATLLCTGFSTQETQKQKEYMDNELFVFRYTPPGIDDGINISNWFITSCTNNEVLIVLRDILYEYWKDYDCVLNYCMFHLFFKFISHEYPDLMSGMPYGSSQKSIALMHHLGDVFNSDKWDRLIGNVAFHKLSYRVDDRIKKDRSNYFNYILSQDFSPVLS